jgi:hypothetical protein
MKYTELKSVGAFIDQNRIVYPSMIEGDRMGWFQTLIAELLLMRSAMSG